VFTDAIEMNPLEPTPTAALFDAIIPAALIFVFIQLIPKNILG
jgi:hypothetical protein